MSTDTRRLPAAQRRAALVAQCAQQRLDAAHEVRSLLAPAEKAHSIVGNLKLPLTIASVVLGMIVTRSGGAMPLVTAGLSLWKLVSKALPLLRLVRGK